MDFVLLDIHHNGGDHTEKTKSAKINVGRSTNDRVIDELADS